MALETTEARRLRPADLDGLVAAMRDAADAGDSVAFRGGGTAPRYGAVGPVCADLEIDTTALDRIVSYAPGDLVVEVEAGMTVSALGERVARDGLRLALDPPQAARATLGGAVACNAFGPLRTRFGTLRDLVVGMSLVRADGTLVRGGGRVVKNVAGFDVPKLAIGSLGTLGAIATVTLRLHPLPETSAALGAEIADAATALRLQFALEAERLEPVAAVARYAAGRWSFSAVFEGFAAGVDEQAVRAAAVAATLGIDLRREDRAGAGDEPAAPAGTHAELRLSLPRALLAEFDLSLADFAAGSRAAPAASVLPSLGVAFVALDVDDPARTAATVARVRERIDALGGRLVLDDPGPLAGAVDPFGAPPAAAALMRAIRARFDPDRRLNPGRSPGGL